MGSSVTLDVIPRTNATKVVAYDAGAQVNGAQEAVTTVTVFLGHALATNDLFLYALAEDNIQTDRVFTVTGTTTSTVTFSGAAFTFPDAAVLVNLEADTVVVNNDGSWPIPNYDGSTIMMYSDPDDLNLVTSKSIRPDGEIQFWSSGIPIWVLSLTQGNHPVRIYRDIGTAAGTGATVTRQATAPTVPAPEAGDIWIKTTASQPDIKYVWISTDGTAFDWIEEVTGEVA